MPWLLINPLRRSTYTYEVLYCVDLYGVSFYKHKNLIDFQALAMKVKFPYDNVPIDQWVTSFIVTSLYPKINFIIQSKYYFAIIDDNFEIFNKVQ